MILLSIMQYHQFRAARAIALAHSAQTASQLATAQAIAHKLAAQKDRAPGEIILPVELFGQLKIMCNGNECHVIKTVAPGVA